MKLTKTSRQEILDVYHTAWDSYLAGDLKVHAACLSPSFRIIGTTESEQFITKKGWLAFCKKTLHQVVGVVQLRNRKLRLDPVGDGVVVVENSHIYVRIDNTWTFYSRFRVTVLIQLERGAWKFVHQHGSLPDSRANEGDTIATEQIKKENQQLREAVKRRTVELEAKNRELEIEAALERVRSRSIGMQKSEELKEVIQIVYDQLVHLRIPVEHTGFILDYKNRNDYNSWIADHLGSPSNITIPYFDALYYNRFNEAKKKGLDFFAVNLGLKEKNRFYRDLFKHLPGFPEESKEFILKQPALTISTVLLDNVALYIENFSGTPFTDDENSVLMRFGKVFQQAYTRFVDLQKAEAQAREAKIETALERVRARAMAMQRSDEVMGVALEMYTQLRKLGFQYGANTILIMDKRTGDMQWWMAGFDEKKFPEAYIIKYFDHPVHNQMITDWKRGKKFGVIPVSGKRKESYDKGLFEGNGFESLPKRVKNWMKKQDSVVFSMAYMKHGALHWGPEPLKPQEEEVLQRFAGTFEQAYTRFLDLQKAEAQAREAQIEAAVERVRARAMSMQKSEELKDLVGTVNAELGKLDVLLDRCFIVTYNLETFDSTWWMAFPESPNPVGLLVKYNNHPFYQNHLKAWRRREVTWQYTLEGANKKSWDDYMFVETEFAKLPSVVKRYMKGAKRVFLSTSFNNFGFLELATITPLSRENNEILLRFAKVFDQTYTRFLDLQKAEAQAREAQIEAALERVRSKSMAMQHSNELAAAAQLLYQQFHSLGIKTFICAYMFIEEERQRQRGWTVAADGSLLPDFFEFPLTGDAILDQRYRSWKQKQPLHEASLKGRANKRHHQYLVSLQPPEFAKQIVDHLPDEVFFYNANFSHGYLFIVNTEPFTAEEKVIAIRFAKVFEQTYTRFLDLQKAEAQAREAQIEAALERVRAQTMAMHNSEDVGKCIVKMFAELTALGVDESTRFGIGILNHDNENNELWTAKHDGEEVRLHIGNLDMASHPLLKSARKAWKEQVLLHQYVLKGEDLLKYYEMLNAAPDYKIQIPVEKLPKREFHYGFIFEHGFFYAFTPHEFQPDLINIIQRFSLLFAQTYRRYLDLVKAEAQAREAQIEAALERVRSRTMAMQHSSELAETSFLLVKQVLGLGINTWGCAFNIFDADQPSSTEWFSNDQGYKSTYKIPREGVFLRYYEAAQRGESLHVEEFLGEACVEHYKYLSTLPGLEEEMKTYAKDGVPLPTSQYDNVAFFKYGYLLFVTYENVPEAHDIFRRFAKVFEQTYTRFLDLQKAEAQAREAQIEAALERVRSRTMGMQKSEDLHEVVKVLYAQLKELGFQQGAAAINIMDPDSGDLDSWTEGFQDGYDLPEKYHVPYFEHRGQRELIMHWRRGTPYAEIEIAGQEKKSFDNFYFYQTDFVRVPEATKQFMMQQEAVTFSMAYMQHGALTWTPSLLSAEQSKILQRFAKVFEQTYTRFLDLQKAEAQAREAQIEAALERVRSCAMAMHSSKELNEVVHELRKQMGMLGQKNLETCVIHLYDELPDYIQSWAAIKPPEEEGEILESIANVPKKGLMIIEEALGNYLANKGDYVIINQEEKLKQWFSFLEKESPDGFTKLAESVNGNVEELRAYWSFADFSGGSLLMVTRDEPDEPTCVLLRRFSNVFGLAYRRFADLKHAEAQTREAQIEASLERVRSKTMAMHSSREVGESVATLFDELSTMKMLSSTDRCGIGIMQPNEIMELWTAEKTEGGKTDLTIGFLDMKPHPLLRSAYNGWVEKKEVNQYILEGEDKLLYYQVMQNQTQYKIKKDYYSGSEKIVHTDFYFNEGVLYVFSQNEFNEESVAVFIRFANVFGQTYRRYLDLKKAEAQAREAQIEAALEKVRSRTMAMQSSEELADAAYVLFEQLNILGVTHERINIGIVNEQNQTIDFWVTEQGGEKLNTKFSGRISEPTTLSKAYEAWKNGEKSLMIDLKGEDLKRWLKYMKEEIKIPFNNAFLHDRRVQTAGFFSKGMLVVTSPEPLQEEALYLLEKFAGVFDLTYTRFSDLKIAEAHARQAELDLKAIKDAKQKAEAALTELQATQKQLIQAEKMASLGELTAGIAHEIQNPLNFVNNFSEVSTELLDEMKAELATGNLQPATEIAEDVKQNLEKILYHGKRADAIVKSMLQHSRSSSGKKELTDINALCDEYLRLAYHGYRAKDKSFNAKFEAHLDSSLPKVNVVAQDIGRVVLNLINNAFYAVSERLRQAQPDSGYEPTVTVSTKNLGDKIEISVKDNGSGISDSIKDKIFQPFFTTKPTGQGTGLGLSLSYDIVKAHGGELKVETSEGFGTSFIISLNPTI